MAEQTSDFMGTEQQNYQLPPIVQE